MNQKYFKNILFLFFWGARPGSCLKKATQIPKAGHPISAINKKGFLHFNFFFWG
jgi:hypothetical protein